MFVRLKVSLLRFFYRFLSARAWKNEDLDLPYSVLHITTHEATLPLRMYADKGGTERPLMVLFHGGGWVIGDVETHNPLCQSLCLKTGCTVVSVDYRLAPEHPCPAAHNDALAATEWIAAHLTELGPNNGQLILAGDSAGANLATSTCLSLAPQVRNLVAGEIVIYPVTDHYSNPYPSYQEKAKGYALTSNLMFWFWDMYLGNTTAKTKPPLTATPIHAPNLESLPATLLITAEHDPLRDEGKEYGKKLRDAGVTLQYSHYPNAEHGFAASAGASPDFKQLMKEVSAWIDSLD